ncbi:MAG: hypothetical protein ACREV3_09435, partial [Gammaproteobacteria bacterium]
DKVLPQRNRLIGTPRALNLETVGLENPRIALRPFSSSSTIKILFTIGIFCLNAPYSAPESEGYATRRKYSLKTRAGATKTGIRLFIKEIVQGFDAFGHS